MKLLHRIVALAVLAAMSLPLAARAADLVSTAKTSASQLISLNSPCTTANCTGFYVGFNVTGLSNSTTSSLLGSVSTGEMSLGGQVGYQYWNGSFFFGPEVFADYTIGGNPVSPTGGAPKYLIGEVVKLGGPLSSLFGPGPSIVLPDVLTSRTISPYVMVGAAERSWGTGLVAGGGVTIDVDSKHWFADVKYMNIQYLGSNQATPTQSVSQENLIQVGLNYKF